MGALAAVLFVRGARPLVCATRAPVPGAVNPYNAYTRSGVRARHPWGGYRSEYALSRGARRFIGSSSSGAGLGRFYAVAMSGGIRYPIQQSAAYGRFQ